MNNFKIAIIVTTFLRDELLFKCIDSLNNNWNKDYYLIVVDQGHPTDKKDEYWRDISNIKGEYIKTEFDIGPLKARNLAIKRVKELGIPYIIMSADSIIFDKVYNFNSDIDFLEQEKDRFLCCFDIKDRLPWECDIKKTDCFELDIPKKLPILFNKEYYQPIDLGRNFFICKTDMLANAMYDEDRLMCDHETSFWRWKELGYKCFYNPSIQASYILDRPKDYDQKRKRLNESKRLMMEKYNLKKWVEYSTDLVDFWNKWRNRKVNV